MNGVTVGTLLVSCMLMIGFVLYTACAILCGVVMRRLGKRPFWVLWTIAFTAAGLRCLLGILVAVGYIDDYNRWLTVITADITGVLFLAGLIGAVLNVKDVHPLDWSLAVLQSNTAQKTIEAAHLISNSNSQKGNRRASHCHQN